MTRPAHFPAHLTESLSMTASQERALPGEALRILVATDSRRQDWRAHATGEYGVTFWMPAGTMARILAVCEPALAA